MWEGAQGEIGLRIRKEFNYGSEWCDQQVVFCEIYPGCVGLQDVTRQNPEFFLDKVPLSCS